MRKKSAKGATFEHNISIQGTSLPQATFINMLWVGPAATIQTDSDGYTGWRGFLWEQHVKDDWAGVSNAPLTDSSGCSRTGKRKKLSRSGGNQYEVHQHVRRWERRVLAISGALTVKCDKHKGTVLYMLLLNRFDCAFGRKMERQLNLKYCSGTDRLCTHKQTLDLEKHAYL